MSKVTDIGTRRPKCQVIDALEDLLEQAKMGNIKYLSAALVMEDHQSSMMTAGADKDVPLCVIIGSIEMMKAGIIEADMMQADLDDEEE